MGEKEKMPKRPRRRKHYCPECDWPLYPRDDEDVRIVEERKRHEGGDPKDKGIDASGFHYYYFRVRMYRRFRCPRCVWKGRWKKVHDGTKEDAT